MNLWKWWDRLPEDVQKALLIMVVATGGASIGCQAGPMVCDPAPPPSTTPMVFDPPPPPSVTPGPPPIPTITIAPGQHFNGRIVQTLPDASMALATIQGSIIDQDGLADRDY